MTVLPTNEGSVSGPDGVDAFFALSGFLITSILIDEINLSGGISRRGFYIRRALRLFPALAFLLVIVAARGS
ncbi:MAG TPA: acyltransferase family protein [Acidimicrobiales bacterium]|nr:acyltransferase family protein [Acidimicrobiales bacterium]